MERDDIIKALGCCTRGRKSKDDRPCFDCPYNECNIVGGTSERQTTGTCQGWLMKDALSLIKELNRDIETISKLLVTKTVTVIEFDKTIERLTEENEWLRAENKELTKANMRLESRFTINEKFKICNIIGGAQIYTETVADYNKLRADFRADTVRKMQDRIAEHATNGYPRKVRLDVIDQIAKEMLEDK